MKHKRNHSKINFQPAAVATTVPEQPNRKSNVSTMSQKTPYQRMMLEIEEILNTRHQLAIYEQIDNQTINVTPKLLEVPAEKEKQLEFIEQESTVPSVFADATSFKSITSTIIRQKASRAMGLQLSLEDVIEGVSF